MATKTIGTGIGKGTRKFPPDVILKGLKEEPHPSYIYGAFMKALDKHHLPLDQSINLMVSAVIQDLRAMASFRPEREKPVILKFINRYEELYISGTGGGGGDAQVDDILQGP